MSVYKVYVENSCIRFVPEGHAGDGEPSLAVAPGESVSMTKLLQKLQFTKKLTVISEKIESVFDGFRASMPLIEAGGGLVSDAGGRVLMIFRNGRWDLPKGKLEPGERIEECA
ncbi:MAG: NUDIX domain-containing protein, partial [Alistipes ihumii]